MISALYICCLKRTHRHDCAVRDLHDSDKRWALQGRFLIIISSYVILINIFYAVGLHDYFPKCFSPSRCNGVRYKKFLAAE
jgi:hypothetical protein